MKKTIDIMDNNKCNQPYTKCIWFDYCSIPEYVKEDKISQEWVDKYCNIANPKCLRYELEYLGRYIPDNMLPDGSIIENLSRVA